MEMHAEQPSRERFIHVASLAERDRRFGGFRKTTGTG